MLDLHTHSSASDGTLSPSQLIHLASKIELQAVAICDHDTISGIDEAITAAKETSIQFVPGVELSTMHKSLPFHLVGLYIDHKHDGLLQGLKHVQKIRTERNPLILQKLRELGIDIPLQQLQDFAQSDSIGRPHIAQLLIQKGVVSTATQAFSKYIGDGKPAFVSKPLLGAAKAISLIRNAGGVAIVAHPHQIKRKGEALVRYIGELTELGLQGIEVFCSGYKSSMTAEYSRIARQYNLVRSGGSDFHGTNKPNIRLGRGMGSLYVHNDLLYPIRALCSSYLGKETPVAKIHENIL